MAEDCYCSCSMTADDSYCSCDRSIICVLDLATPRFEIAVRQPPPLNFGKLLSKRSSRAYKSMTAARKTDEVANAAARKRFTATCSTEELHCSPAAEDHHCGAPLQVQSSRSEVVLAADPDSHAADGPQAPDWRATDPQAPDFYTAELQMTDLQLRKYDFCVIDYPQASTDFHATDPQTADFFAVITPNASDDFDAVDLTGDYYHPQRSVDFGGWEERASSDSAAQVRSPENGTRVLGVGVARKEEGSLWSRVKKYISRGLCCQQR